MERRNLREEGDSTMRLSRALVAAALLTVPCLPLPAHAQDAKLTVGTTDTVRSILERQKGQRVGLVLNTGGSELAGVVTFVGDKVVHISELTGREFSDAVVSLDGILAVVIRVRNR
jgi:hypothetical protein